MHLRLALTLAIGILVTVGCGDATQAPLALSGTVEFDGKPVEDGSITFTSSTGAVANGSINQGSYSIPVDRSVPAGTYGVQITGQEKTGRQIPDSDAPGQKMDEIRSIIPDKYNSQSQLSVDITPQNATALDFALTSD